MFCAAYLTEHSPRSPPESLASILVLCLRVYSARCGCFVTDMLKQQPPGCFVLHPLEMCDVKAQQAGRYPCASVADDRVFESHSTPNDCQGDYRVGTIRLAVLLCKSQQVTLLVKEQLCEAS